MSHFEPSADGKDLLFTREDERLPMNLAPLWTLNGRFVPDRRTQSLHAFGEATPGGKTPSANWTPARQRTRLTLAAESIILRYKGSGSPADCGCPRAGSQSAVDARDWAYHARSVLDNYFTGHPRIGELRSSAHAIDASITAYQRELSKPQPVEFRISPAQEPAPLIHGNASP